VMKKRRPKVPTRIEDYEPGKCAKVTTTAILITTDGDFFVGTNWCKNPQTTCPRGDMPTGQGYELCKSICEQPSHAEVDVCLKAGSRAEGSKVILIGHYYACEDCQKVMKKYGVKEVYFLDADFNRICFA